MPAVLLRQPGFAYSACESFTKNKEGIQEFKETGDSQYIYQSKLDKACFQHDVAIGRFKDLTRRTASDKILRDKVFSVPKNPKYDRYQRGIASMVYEFFDKESALLSDKSASGSGILKWKYVLAEESHKQIIRKFNKRKVRSSFIDNVWGADLADMHLINRFNKEICFLLCVIDIFSKCAWVIPLKNKRNLLQLLMLFQKSQKNLTANQTKYR